MQPQGSKEMEEEKWMRYFNEFIEGRIRDIILSLSRVEIPRTQQAAEKDMEEQQVSVSYRTTETLRAWVWLRKVSEAQN